MGFVDSHRGSNRTVIYTSDGRGIVLGAGDSLSLSPLGSYRGNGIVLSATTSSVFLKSFILSAPADCLVSIRDGIDFYVRELKTCEEYTS